MHITINGYYAVIAYYAIAYVNERLLPTGTECAKKQKKPIIIQIVLGMAPEDGACFVTYCDIS